MDVLVAALGAAGFQKVKVLHGEDGVSLLERVGGFFFSDMEERVIDRHIDELKAGHTIIAIPTDSDRVDEAVRLASQNGVRGLVHFGSFAITWHTK